MSYTLRGRIESRLAAAALPFLVACVIAGLLRVWWPVELVGVMVGIGLALDVVLYRRVLVYQPGWAAVPLGVLELAATMAWPPWRRTRAISVKNGGMLSNVTRSKCPSS